MGLSGIGIEGVLKKVPIPLFEWIAVLLILLSTNYALSNGDGTFGAAVDIGFPTFSAPAGGLAADLNGDSRIDLVITGRGILGSGLQGTYVFLNNGN